MQRTTLSRRKFLGCALAANAAAMGIRAPAEAAMKRGDRPKTVNLADLGGAQVALPDAYSGKIVVIHFWASWCPPCLKEIDALDALFGQYRERGLAPVSVNVGESKAVVAASLCDRKVSYPILLDTNQATARLYGVTGLPTTFLLDRAGVIEFKVLGEVGREALRRVLSGML